MSDYRVFRDALIEAIEGVPDAGKVQKLRQIKSWAEYIRAFVATVKDVRQVRGWWVMRERREDDYLTFGSINARHTFVIRGVLGIEDAADTDATFGELVDDVMDALGGVAVTNAWTVSACRTRVMEPRDFSVLCHFVEIEMTLERERDA